VDRGQVVTLFRQLGLQPRSFDLLTALARMVERRVIVSTGIPESAAPGLSPQRSANSADHEEHPRSNNRHDAD
jgi:hypothetical protein